MFSKNTNEVFSFVCSLVSLMIGHQSLYLCSHKTRNHFSFLNQTLWSLLFDTVFSLQVFWVFVFSQFVVLCSRMKKILTVTGSNVLSNGIINHRTTILYTAFSSYLMVFITLEPIAFKNYDGSFQVSRFCCLFFHLLLPSISQN